MNADMQRLCKAVDEEVARHGYTREGIVRAVLKELSIPSEAMMQAVADSLEKPRMHVGHRGADQCVGAIRAYQDVIDSIYAGHEAVHRDKPSGGKSLN